MELRWHAHVENHVVKVLFERKFKVVQLTFYRLRHEDFLLEGFAIKKNTLKTVGSKALINECVNATGDYSFFPIYHELPIRFKNSIMWSTRPIHRNSYYPFKATVLWPMVEGDILLRRL